MLAWTDVRLISLDKVGYKQEYGIDYNETFASIAKITAIRAMLAIVAIRRWQLWQMDVIFLFYFLHGDLQETIFMKPPLGYACPPNHICHLHKSLYGLK